MEYKFLLINPSYDHPIVSTIIELEKLRVRHLETKVQPLIFFQLRDIFHMLESLWSARIEWNNTTISELIESKIEKKWHPEDTIKEIENMEEAMHYIESKIIEWKSITKQLLFDIHSMVVKDLIREGDKNPWSYRQSNVSISQSEHIPPHHLQVPPLMDKLFDFINEDKEKKYKLLSIAIAHHAFAWIHPFGNWNGRTVRLLTYAMLIQQWFNVNSWRILNPTAIFCVNRNEYYDKLAIADKLTEEWFLDRSNRVLEGLLREINKIDNLLDKDYLVDQILIPTLKHALEKKWILEEDYKILIEVVNKMEIEQKDIKHLFPWKVPQEISRRIRILKDKWMIKPLKENSRKYTISFTNNYLLRSIIKILRDKWFDSIIDNSIN